MYINYLLRKICFNKFNGIKGNNYLRNILLLSIFFTLFVVYILTIAETSFRYYDIYDAFGPLSSPKLLFVFTLLIVFLAYLLTLLTKDGIMVILCISAILIRYTIPSLADVYYVSDFYDAPWHMTRGHYVISTGHSDPNVDRYFDIQPAFFWWTSIFVNVLWGAPNSMLASPILFLVKNFNTLILIILLPILLALFKTLGFKSSSAWILCSFTILLSYSRLHYSAQAYTYALYWVSVLLMVKQLYIFNKKLSLSFIPIALSLVYLHQGTALYTQFSILGLLGFKILELMYYNLHGRDNSRYQDVREQILLLFLQSIVLSFAWFCYLMYITKWTFENFVFTIKQVIEFLQTPHAVARHVHRRNPLWQQIVYIKSVFFIFLLFFSLIYIALNKKFRSIFFIMLTVSMVIGGIAIALGGAGYIERIFEIQIPFVAVSLYDLYIGSMKTYRKIIKIILVKIFIISQFLSFSGWNIHSVPYSTYFSEYIFVSKYVDKTQISRWVWSLEYLNSTSNYSKSKETIYIKIIQHHTLRFTYYYVDDYLVTERLINKILSYGNLIYNTRTYRLVVYTSEKYV